MFMEMLLLKLGGAVAKSVLSLWLGEGTVLGSMSGTAVDALVEQVPNLFDHLLRGACNYAVEIAMTLPHGTAAPPSSSSCAVMPADRCPSRRISSPPSPPPRPAGCRRAGRTGSLTADAPWRSSTAPTTTGNGSLT